MESAPILNSALTLAVNDKKYDRDVGFYIDKAKEIANGGGDVITQLQADALGLVIHLDFNDAEKPIDTEYGKLMHYEWLVLERNRIGGRPGRVASIVTRRADKKLEYSLYVNDMGIKA